MNHDVVALAPRCPGLRSAAAALAIVLATAAQAGPTDISSTPILTTTAALVKPNVMLLMDVSGSMGRTHMPDEVETATRPQSIGYKSHQCNSLYYDPAQPYLLPKDYLGVEFPEPTFTSAPYAGFGAYYAVPDLRVTNLETQFVAYDGTTLETPSPFPDTPQAAYYYVYSGPETLSYATLPCKQLDTGSSTTTAGGGTWTKVNVATASPEQRRNFAIWYSYYRTRLALIKSAASLAFSPLRDTKRVGFITMEPKDSPTDAGINPLRFLKLDDFGTAQKQRWFAKMFSQAASGASPAREGLARVGRYYGGKEDSINTNMPASGADDPVQYACQQNFTIMTTDGYWNGQTETPTGGGLYGGGLQLDGTTLVGQQDGVLSDPYSPRPMFDGTSTGTRVDIDKTNAYTSGVCSIAGGRYKSTYQTTQRTWVVNRDTIKYPRHTVQYKAASQQFEAQTTQTTKTVTQTPQTKEQFALERHHFAKEQYQAVKWQEQITRVRDQYQLQTIQVQAKTQQMIEKDSHTWKTTEQWTTATSQYVLATTQYVLQQDQLRLTVEQVYKMQFQIVAHSGSEHGVPVAGTCVDGGGIVCETVVQFDSTLVDPDDCVAGTGPAPDYLRTTCTPGSLAQPDHAVATCAVGVVHSGPPNYTKSTCTRVVGTPTPIATSCAAGTTQTGAPNYIINICTLPGANNTSNGVASCTIGSTTTGAPDYITTTCSKPLGPNNLPATPSAACTPGSTTDSNFVTTTCVKSIDTSGWAGSCTPDPGLAPAYTKVTCGTPVETIAAVPSASCVAGNSGPPNYIQTTCTPTAGGLYPSWTPVQTCASGSTTGAPDYFETSCWNQPGVNNQTVFTTAALCGPVGTTTPVADPWVTKICSKPYDNAADFTAPAGCVPNPGTSFPYLRVTCTPGPTVPPYPPTPVDPRVECGTFGVTVGAAPDYVVTHCDKVGATSGPADVCIPGIGPAPDFIVTTCGDVYTDTPVAWCDTAAAPYTDGIDTVTCVKPAGANNGTTNIATACVPATGVAPDYVTVTCPAPSVTVTIVDPNTCPTGTTVGPAPAVLVTTCSAPAAVAPYAAWTAVPTCTNNWDGTVRTTCRQPAATNFAARDSAPCTTNTDGNYVTTTCTTVITDDYPITCSAVTQTGTGPEVTCGAPIVATGVPASSCTVGVSGSPTDYTTTTACNITGDTGFVDFAGICTNSSGVSPTWVHTQCGTPRLLTDHIADSGCVNGTDAGTGIQTVCTDDAAGPGLTYSVAVVTTTTTTRLSGTSVLGTPTVATSTGASSPFNGGACYASPPVMPPKPPVDIAGCSAWPCSSSTAGPAGSTNSLADVAQYYYRTDLRPSMSNSPGVPPAGPGIEDDNAPHQHMTTFALALGVSGTLQYRSDYRNLSTTTGDFAAIRAGTKDWPLWPDPLLDYNNFTNYNNPKSIDDFWHAAVDGRGRFFSASDPTSVVEGLGDALAKIDDVLASGTADSVSTLQPTTTNNFVYSTSYVSGSWQGEIQARTLNVTTGTPVDPPVWSAQALLGPRQRATCDLREIHVIRGGNALAPFTQNTTICGDPTPHNDLNATELLNFGLGQVSGLSQWGFMTASQKTAVQNPGVLVNFIRGQRALEGFVIGDDNKLLRKRAGNVGDGILGDIVDSQAVYVGEPFATYHENDYAGFKSSNSGRIPMLYVGANDGMLHAFYASLTDANGGKEAWAVIPSAVLSNLYKLADDNYKRDGHQFYVDGTPVVGDVWDGSQWRTILVGGLNAGGKGYYALDVTVPGALPIAKWEFKQDNGTCPSPAINVTPSNLKADCNLGLTFGKPVITKLAGRWVVMFTSGYNNINGASSGDGQGFLYVVDALDGTLIHKIGTGVGDADLPLGPSGLAQINNFVDNVVVDNTTRRVYGGDLFGNVWRFDFTSPTATLIGTATDATLARNPQPITTRPELAEIDGKPFIMVGTGKLLGSSDVTYTGTQSVYGFTDPLTGPSPLASPLRSILRPLAVTQTGTGATAVRTIGCSTTGAACDRPAGWVIDLAEAGERVNVDMKLVLGALVFASNVPKNEPCEVGGHSWFNQVDFRTGAPIPGAVTSEFLADSINVGFNVLQLPPATVGGNPTYTGLFRQGKASSVNKTVTPPEPIPSGKRISWREVIQ